MEIPGLGPVTRDDEFGWYTSRPMIVPVLNGKACRIVVEGYDDDPRKEEFHAAIANFLSAPASVLKDAERDLFRYYQYCVEGREDLYDDEDEVIPIESPGEVWGLVDLGSEAVVTRRAYGDRGIYVSVECGCEWEEEHGLQIVFKNGQRVNKIGPYDGHVTNSDATGNEALEDVVFAQSQ